MGDLLKVHTYNMPSGGYFLCELEWMARAEPRAKIYNSFVVPHLFIMLVWWWWWWWWRFPPYLRIHRGRPERGHIISYEDDGLDRVVDRHNANELNTIAQAEEKTTTPNEMMLNMIPMPLFSPVNMLMGSGWIITMISRRRRRRSRRLLWWEWEYKTNNNNNTEFVFARPSSAWFVICVVIKKKPWLNRGL